MNDIRLDKVLHSLNKMILKKEYPYYILHEISKFKDYLMEKFFVYSEVSI
jgi:hypothetical protein